MNNLHRELAPISAAAWADMEQEARRTFTRHVAGRRIVDVPEPGGAELSGVGTGHLEAAEAPADGVVAHTDTKAAIVGAGAVGSASALSQSVARIPPAVAEDHNSTSFDSRKMTTKSKVLRFARPRLPLNRNSTTMSA